MTSLRHLRIRMRRAAADGGRYDLPRLAALLARPEFEPLARFVADWGVDVPALQAEIDGLVEQARGEVEASEGTGGGTLPPALQALLTQLQEVAAAGEDVEPLLEELRAGLLEWQPGTEEQADAVIEQLRAALGS